jgi:Flp pilus assembly protein protease CpaA
MRKIDIARVALSFAGVILAMTFVLLCFRWQAMTASDVKAFAFLIVGVAAPSPLAGSLNKLQSNGGLIATPVPVTRPIDRREPPK